MFFYVRVLDQQQFYVFQRIYEKMLSNFDAATNCGAQKHQGHKRKADELLLRIHFYEILFRLFCFYGQHPILILIPTVTHITSSFTSANQDWTTTA